MKMIALKSTSRSLSGGILCVTGFSRRHIDRATSNVKVCLQWRCKGLVGWYDVMLQLCNFPVNNTDDGHRERAVTTLHPELSIPRGKAMNHARTHLDLFS